jgi:hypothetical protein
MGMVLNSRRERGSRAISALAYHFGAEQANPATHSVFEQTDTVSRDESASKKSSSI